jgi:hypothetical protein
MSEMIYISNDLEKNLDYHNIGTKFPSLLTMINDPLSDKEIIFIVILVN